MTADWPGRWSVLRLAVAFEGSLAILALAIGWLVDQAPLQEHLSWSPADFGLGILATLPLLVGLVFCVRAPWRPLARIRTFCTEVIRPFFKASTVFDLAVISLVAGVAEELLFRGVVQAALSAWLGLWPGLLLASALFGLVHLVTLTYGILVTLVGIYLGWLFVASDNLLVVMVAHALYDFIALVFLVRGPQLGRQP
jgi:membrane protease YdiL (CAAX protease family)